MPRSHPSRKGLKYRVQTSPKPLRNQVGRTVPQRVNAWSTPMGLRQLPADQRCTRWSAAVSVEVRPSEGGRWGDPGRVDVVASRTTCSDSKRNYTHARTVAEETVLGGPGPDDLRGCMIHTGWVVLKTQPRHEVVAVNAIDARGVESYVPLLSRPAPLSHCFPVTYSRVFGSRPMTCCAFAQHRASRICCRGLLAGARARWRD